MFAELLIGLRSVVPNVKRELFRKNFLLFMKLNFAKGKNYTNKVVQANII